jgi:polyisoprenyl-teichoic acid--peptidoglycan teichoic acid transferase
MVGNTRRRSHARPTTRARRVSEAPVSRRSVPIRRLLLVALAVVMGAGLLGGVLIWQRANTFNERVSFAPGLSATLLGPLRSDEPVNIAMFGYSDDSRQGAYLSDSINILSIDPVTDTTSLIPIPRDLWVQGAPEMPAGKINEAFRSGYLAADIRRAGDLASGVLAHVTGLEIHGWMAIDFDGFSAVVDAIGGVTIQNPRAFRYSWYPAQVERGRYPNRFERGTLDLGGTEALAYVRARYADSAAESGDFARSVRQQRVISAIRAELSGMRFIPNALAVMEAAEETLRTDLSVVDLLLLSGHLDIDRRVELGEGEILYATRNSHGQYILAVLGQQDAADYRPLHRHIESGLQQPLPTDAPEDE